MIKKDDVSSAAEDVTLATQLTEGTGSLVAQPQEQQQGGRIDAEIDTPVRRGLTRKDMNTKYWITALLCLALAGNHYWSVIFVWKIEHMSTLFCSVSCVSLLADAAVVLDMMKNSLHSLLSTSYIKKTYKYPVVMSQHHSTNNSTIG